MILPLHNRLILACELVLLVVLICLQVTTHMKKPHIPNSEVADLRSLRISYEKDGENDEGLIIMAHDLSKRIESLSAVYSFTLQDLCFVMGRFPDGYKSHFTAVSFTLTQSADISLELSAEFSDAGDLERISVGLCLQ